MMSGGENNLPFPEHLSPSPALPVDPRIPLTPPLRRGQPRQYHRLAAVRKQQGISIRTAARHLNNDVARVRVQEEPSCDLTISELRKWQQLLDVPLADLLVDPGHGLSTPVLERAKMLRVMKTVVTIRERATTPAMQRLAEMLFEQIVDVMPDLKDVPAWHSVGKRRGLDEYGRAAERHISEDQLFRIPHHGDY